MAYDTVCIKSPYMTEDAAYSVFNAAREREGVDLKLSQRISIATGEVDYQITTGKLSGSYDSRISVRLDDTEVQVVKTGHDIVSSLLRCGTTKYLNVPQRVSCEPYIYIEASVHKCMLGHNVYGGPEVFLDCVKWLVELVQAILGVELPLYEEWEVHRVDVAEVYRLQSFEACEEWFRGMKNCRFPRREKGISTYGSHGLFIAGETTAIKFYHKGPEFQIHDKARLKKFLDEEPLMDIISVANEIIRCEVEVRKRKLKYDFGGRVPLVGEVTDDYLNGVYDAEVRKLLREGKAGSQNKTVRRAQAVEKRLFTMYDDRLAGLLLGTWYKLSARGEEATRKNMNYETLRRHKRKLEDAGVAWTGTDVVVKMFELVPQDFAPVRTDPRRLVIPMEEAKIFLRKHVMLHDEKYMERV